jgi:hypothetical protein
MSSTVVSRDERRPLAAAFSTFAQMRTVLTRVILQSIA